MLSVNALSRHLGRASFCMLLGDYAMSVWLDVFCGDMRVFRKLTAMVDKYRLPPGDYLIFTQVSLSQLLHYSGRSQLRSPPI